MSAAFRYDLKDRFMILTKGIEKCLYIYPEEEWADLVERLKKAMRPRKVKPQSSAFFSQTRLNANLINREEY